LLLHTAILYFVFFGADICIIKEVPNLMREDQAREPFAKRLPQFSCLFIPGVEGTLGLKREIKQSLQLYSQELGSFIHCGARFPTMNVAA